jgi:peptide deformylase
MAVCSVLKMGDARLRRQAQPVSDFNTPALQALIADLFDTMQVTGGVGIAAPQIGVDLQVVVFGFERSERYPEAGTVPRTVLINPVITPVGEQQETGWEGCLSVPGMRGQVPRYAQIRYQGFDELGVAIDRQVSGFHARLVQHECDHLWGILYPQRIRDMTQFGFTDVLFSERKD